MIAIILVAGIGKRLMPLTRDIPKALLKIEGKSVLEYAIIKCLNNGITKFVIVVGHGKETVSEECNTIRMRFNADIRLVENKRYLDTNTAYSLNLGLNQIFDDILIINGDNVFDELIITNLLKTSRTSLVIDNFKDLNNESFKVILSENVIEQIGKDIDIIRSTGEFIGISKVSNTEIASFKRILQKMVENNLQQYYDIAFKELNREVSIDFVYTNGLRWTEIDTIDDLEYAKKLYSY